ncbi:hypothetical protein GCM10018785_55900 [Streptomyces longispororuber]|uniref:Uncharacterized protein n=1 Tax=Streptomyces longispororuber TaxID=68230 RepID=A0A919A0G0_9ACTN|nr:hypothetical protein [Streptomyces longispororuber]GHE80672.1 hypothetical protein GCM10018785_55900 [Streptomyces longispororuber]
MAVPNSFFRSERAMKLRAEGRAQARAEVVVLILEKRGVTVPDDVRERVMGCSDLDTLDVWFSRALKAESAEELFREAGR